MNAPLASKLCLCEPCCGDASARGRHLRLVLAEFVAFYNTERPHRSLGLETPQPAVRPAAGPIDSRPVLDGLHHVYERTG